MQKIWIFFDNFCFFVLHLFPEIKVQFFKPNCFPGKRGSNHRESDPESQIPTSVTGETTIPVTSASEASKRLAPLLRVDQPSSDDEKEETQAPLTSKFIRNGSELRRSLRRINSMTRRKLSPSSTSMAPPKSPKTGRKHSQGSLTDFVSHVWK